MMRAEIRRCPFGCVDFLEHHARRAVQLADDDALGAVDDEGAEVGEQRQLAEIDLLLDDVARPLDAVDLLVDDELQRRLERRRVGHVALDALLDGVLRLAERVADELQREVLVDVGDREQVLEDALEPDVLAVVRGGIQSGAAPRRRASGCRGDGAFPSPRRASPNEICFIDSGMYHPGRRRKTARAPAARVRGRRSGENDSDCDVRGVRHDARRVE